MNSPVQSTVGPFLSLTDERLEIRGSTWFVKHPQLLRGGTLVWSTGVLVQTSSSSSWLHPAPDLRQPASFQVKGLGQPDPVLAVRAQPLIMTSLPLWGPDPIDSISPKNPCCLHNKRWVMVKGWLFPSPRASEWQENNFCFLSRWSTKVQTNRPPINHCEIGKSCFQTLEFGTRLWL